MLDGSKSSPAVVELFALTTSETDLVAQIHDLAQNFGNRLAGLDVTRVVIRRADTPPRPSNTEGPRTRLLAEGALTTTARGRVTDTRLLNGRDLAARAGGGRTKATIDAEAAALVDVGAYEGAVAAALSALDD